MKEIFDNLTRVNVNCILHIYIYPECKEKSVCELENTLIVNVSYEIFLCCSLHKSLSKACSSFLQTQHTAKSPLDLTFLIDFFPFEYTYSELTVIIFPCFVDL